MFLRTKYKLLFDDVAGSKVAKKLNLLNIILSVMVAIQIVAVIFVVFASIFESLPISVYFIFIFLLTAKNAIDVYVLLSIKKEALQIYETKKSDKQLNGVFAGFINLCERYVQICTVCTIVVLFFSVVVVGVIIYSFVAIGSDIKSFLRIFSSGLLLVIIILNNVFNHRCTSLDNDFANKYQLEIDKLYYLSCQNTTMPNLSTKKPSRLLLFLACVLYGKPSLKHRFNAKINKKVFKGLKPPYMIINNHSSSADFRVVSPALYPILSNFIIAYSQFVGRTNLFHKMGIIPKRQFDNSLGAIREAQKVFKRKGVLTFYPEGKVSSDGRSGIVRPAMAKFIKLCGVPVVFMHTQGIYVARPKWAKELRNFDVSVDFELMLTAEETKTKTVEEINEIMQAHYAKVDDFEYQRKNKIILKSKRRAEGLHNLLYSCPHCNANFKMNSKENQLYCENCGKKWYVTPLNTLQSTEEGGTEFSKITDWYDWERSIVDEEIKTNEYAFSSRCELQFLADFKGWHTLGLGSILQNETGFRFVGDDGSTIDFDTTSVFSLPFDYDWGVYLNDERFSYRVIVQNKAFGTKINFAVEKFFELNHSNIK